MDVRHKTGYLYFRGRARHDGYPPVRYFCPGSCESFEPEPVRRTGSDYFGSEAPARRSSRLGFQANLSDERTETGCWYFGGGGGGPCVNVRGWDRVPRCLHWTRSQVAGWIESLGFSLYRVSSVLKLPVIFVAGNLQVTSSDNGADSIPSNIASKLPVTYR